MLIQNPDGVAFFGCPSNMHTRLRSGATAEQRWHRPSFDMRGSRTPQLPPPHHTVVEATPSFYIHEDAVFDHTALTECVPGWALDDQSAEVAMLHQLRAHAARTLDPRLASLFVVPVYPYVSLLAGACAGTEHPARMAAAAAALSCSAWWSRRHGADHMLITNTFRLGALGALRPLLTNATVAWFEAPSAPRRGPGTLARLVSWRCTVVIPYLASLYCQQQRAARPTRSCPEAAGGEAVGGGAAGGEAAAVGGEAAAVAGGEAATAAAGGEAAEAAGTGGRSVSLFFQGSLSTATRVRGSLTQLQPHAPEAATPYTTGCNPIHHRLQPHFSGLSPHFSRPPRAASIAAGCAHRRRTAGRRAAQRLGPSRCSGCSKSRACPRRAASARVASLEAQGALPHARERSPDRLGALGGALHPVAEHPR